MRKPGCGQSLAGTAFRKTTTAIRLGSRKAFFAISHPDVLGSAAYEPDTGFGVRSVGDDITRANAVACRYAKPINVSDKGKRRFEVAVTTAKNRDWRVEAHERHFSFHRIGTP